MQTIDEVLLNSDSNEKFIKALMSSLVQSTRASNNIPSGEGGDFDYFSTFPEFENESKNLSENVGSLISKLCGVVSGSQHIPLPNEISSSHYEMVVDIIDLLLESADNQLDSLAQSSSKIKTNARMSLALDRDRIMRDHNNIPKYQLFDERDLLYNSRETPFKPKLTSKPFGFGPLDLTPRQKPVEELDNTLLAPTTYYPHPYHDEINHFFNARNHNIFTESSYINPIMPSFQQPFMYIETEDALRRAMDELEITKEIAVDLEHHSFRSFLGLTCLMQISSREKDYVIDVIALKKNLGSILLPLFADPSIIKIFHGGESDIMWLQRDFGIYVVGCFDTFYAAKVLKYPVLSLAHLLKYYCGITANKKYQLADWRIRPLTKDMLAYAKDDTHYLLYIYDCMRRDIQQQYGETGILSVIDSSRRMCLRKYEKDVFCTIGYKKLLSYAPLRVKRGTTSSSNSVESISTLTTEQDLAMSALWNWRDLAARQEDESPLFIMSNAELVRIGKAVPSSESEVLACAPLTDFVKRHVLQVLGVITAVLSTKSVLYQETAEYANFPKEYSSNVNFAKLTNSNNISDATFERAEQLQRCHPVDANGRGVLSRIEGYSSVVDFIPTLYDMSNASGVDNGMDVADPNIQQMLFDLAKWKASVNKPSNAIVKGFHSQSPVDPTLQTSSGSILSSDIIDKLSLSKEHINKSVLRKDPSENSFNVISNDSISYEEKLAQPTVSAHEMTDEEAMNSLPSSLAEIYEISNRNKWKNKDKKRNREVVDEDSAAGVSRGGKAQDEGAVKEGIDGNVVDKSVEGSVDFAISIGWVPKESRSAVIDRHYQEERINTAVDIGGMEVTTDCEFKGKKNGKKSDANNSKSNNSSASNSIGSNKSMSSKQSHEERPFDYKGLDQSGALEGISAMAAAAASSSKKPGTVSHGMTRAVTNPFLPQSSTGQKYQGEYKDKDKARGNLPPKGGGNSNTNTTVVERRDRERSHVYSNK